MTRDERTRASLLEETSQTYCKTGRNKTIITAVFIFMIILYAIITFVILKADDAENNINCIMPAHVFGSTLIFNMMIVLTTSLIGDDSNLDKRNPAALKAAGTMTSGKFLCTLPFRGKDLMNLRLINWERALTAKAALSVMLQIMLLVLQTRGYEIKGFFIGASILLMFLGEILLMFSYLTKSKKAEFTVSACSAIILIAGSMFILDISDRASTLTIPTGFLGDALSALSGITGIILTIVLTAVTILIGEKCMSRRKLMSWGIR